MRIIHLHTATYTQNSPVHADKVNANLEYLLAHEGVEAITSVEHSHAVATTMGARNQIEQTYSFSTTITYQLNEQGLELEREDARAEAKLAEVRDYGRHPFAY